jgi:hypothetical protein
MQNLRAFGTQLRAHERTSTDVLSVSRRPFGARLHKLTLAAMFNGGLSNVLSQDVFDVATLRSHGEIKGKLRTRLRGLHVWMSLRSCHG